MSDPFLGEIKVVSFNFAPKGWAQCNGQLLPINQNQALFSLLGTTYGGNGTLTFGLPDLRGRVPLHKGNGHTQGERAGEQAHTLTSGELPAHQHTAQGSTAAASAGAPSSTRVLAKSTGATMYAAPTNLAPMATGALSNVGGSQPHLNMQPFLVLTFCIALQGIFPSQS